MNQGQTNQSRVSARLLAAAVLLAAAGAWAQDSQNDQGVPVRRAIPVDQDQGQDQTNIPTARAVPFEPFDSPTPRPAPAATPPPEAPQGVYNDQNVVTQPAPGGEQSADEEQLDFANGFYSRGAVDMAAPEYEKYLANYPDAPMLDRESALFRLGECYRKLGNVNAARNAYETLLLNYGIGQFIGPAAYRLADMCYAAKDYEGALDYYRKASVRLTDPALALAAKFYAARSLEELQLPTDARIAYEDIVDTPGENPFREPSRLALAEILEMYGRKPDALVQFEALAKEAEQPPVKVEALVKAGLLDVELGNPEKGAADFNKALAMPEIGDWEPIAQIGLLRVLYESGKYGELLTKYQAAFDSVPADNKAEVLILAADSKRQTGDFAGASDLYGQIIKDYPNSVYADEAKYQQLVSLYNAGDPGLIPAIDAYLASNPEANRRDEVTLLKAEALFKAQNFADAAALYASLEDSTLIPNYRADSLLKLAWCYMQINQPDRAIAALTSFLKDYPDHRMAPSALAQRAVAYQQTKDLTSALKDFSQLLDTYPKAKERELALKEKALILGEQEDNDGMSDTFKQLLAEYPHSSAAAQANYWIGFAAFSDKNYKDCIEPLDKARKLDKAEFFERASVRIIAAYYTLGDRDSLASEVDLYNENHPKDKVQAEVLRWLGKSYLDAKDYPNAVKYLTQLSTRDEVTPDDWLNLGQAELGAQQYPDAINAINKYLAAQSDPALQAQGLLALGQAQLESSKLDDAQASADKACSLQPEGLPNAQGRMLSGDIQVARGDFEAASKIYQSIAVIIDDPNVTPQAMEKAYDCLNRLGDSADAAKLLNQLQTKYPEYQIKAGGLIGAQ
ncbi:MAG: tetratricopeptide repeat protein [Chthoniobacteraceae bacterium]